MSTDSIEQLKQKIECWLAENLDTKRQGHTRRVRETAAHLAKRYGIDPEKADLAAMMHDMYRFHGQQEREDALVDRLGLPARYKGNLKLAHSKVAAAALAADWGIHDREILDAVAYHTTGRAGMCPLEKVVYLADAIEPARDYPGVDALRQLAEEDLDRACLASLESTLAFVRAGGEAVDQDTVRARDSLKEEINEHERNVHAGGAGH